MGRGIGPFSWRQLASALIVVAIAAVGLFVATRPVASNPLVPGPAAQATQYIVGPTTSGLKIGQSAPDFAVRRADGSTGPLTDLEGNPIRLSDLRGRPVWVNFWASWCPPCQAETPVLRDMAAQYKAQGLVIVAVSVQEATVDDVRAYAQRYGLGYTIGADLRGDVFRQYRIYGLPTQFFLDGNGVIRWIVQGPVDHDMAVAALKLILPAAGSSPEATPSR